MREAMSIAEIAPVMYCACTITHDRGYFYSVKHASHDLRQQIVTCALLIDYIFLSDDSTVTPFLP